MKKPNAFTLIELLIVIGIIAILAAAVIVAINPQRQFAQARDATRSSHINSLSNSLLSYQVSHAGGWGSITLSEELKEICNTNEVDPVNCEGLIDLSSLVNGGYLNKIPVDPQATGIGTGYFISKYNILVADKSENKFIGIGITEEVYLENQPIQVASANDLQKIGTGIDGWNMDSDYVQVSNINWEDHENTYFVPIGYGEGTAFTSFVGTFDGNGYDIYNLKIDQSEDSAIGMFAAINGGTIENIRLNNVEISGNQNVGGLAGLNTGNIENCYISGIVQGRTQVGGLVGYTLNDSLIADCQSDVDVSGDEKYIGGLAGAVGNNSLISKSSATGTVTTQESYVGGLVGASMSSNIEESFATGDVYGGQDEDNASVAGGLVGINSAGDIDKSYATGNVIATHEYGGGLVAVHQGGTHISNVFSTGDVEGAAFVGGLVGFNPDSYITNGYTTGSVPDVEEWHTGGLVGWAVGIENSLYFNYQESTQDDCDGGDPRTTSQMKSGTEDSYINPDGTVDETQNEDNLIYDGWSDQIWDFGTDQDYPELII